MKAIILKITPRCNLHTYEDWLYLHRKKLTGCKYVKLSSKVRVRVEVKISYHKFYQTLLPSVTQSIKTILNEMICLSRFKDKWIEENYYEYIVIFSSKSSKCDKCKL